ncbi:hypothetical protein CIHG_03776 [Coccidioides immitis H538.4]|uniref:Uncharacterized protein n=1 Tax=Coccidioides immitis H538.4 TaxID=396776 RepID=A0A0J8RMA3_COCIT|nr:hypothetical protein CIHG_03776 [Coccidioides immitis H538.4]
MLDIAPDPGAQRHGSIAGIGVGVTQPPNRSTAKPGTGVRSMLDPIAPSPLRLTQSATSSPTTDTAPSQETPEGHRRASDASSKGLPEIKKRHGVDPQQDYQFEMLPSIPNYALPKRVTQGGKLGHHNNTTHKNSMAAVMSGADFGPFPGAPRVKIPIFTTRTVAVTRHETAQYKFYELDEYSRQICDRFWEGHQHGSRV